MHAEDRARIVAEINRLANILDPAGAADHEARMKQAEAEREALSLLGFPSGKPESVRAVEDDEDRIKSILTDPNATPEEIENAKRTLGYSDN